MLLSELINKLVSLREEHGESFIGMDINNNIKFHIDYTIDIYDGCPVIILHPIDKTKLN